MGNGGIVFGSICIDTFGQPAGDMNGKFLGGVSALNFESLVVHMLFSPFVAVKQSETSSILSEHIFQPKDRFQVQNFVWITITVSVHGFSVLRFRAEDSKVNTYMKLH